MNNRDFLIASLRCARIRVQLLQNEIDQIGVALAHDMVTPDDAVEWLALIGALPFLDAAPLPDVVPAVLSVAAE